MPLELTAHLTRQKAFSFKTFGPPHLRGPEGPLAHIYKELIEIEENPFDVEEWIDVVILAFDGALRAGYSPADVVRALEAKQTKNEGRKWPDWREVPPGTAIEHVRDEDGK